jgi:cytochrome c553
MCALGVFTDKHSSDRFTRMQTLRVIAFCCVMALPLSTAKAASNQELVEVNSATPNLKHGSELFQTCAKCHGADGGGSRAIGTPGIAGQHFRVLAKQLVDYQQERRYDFRMEEIAKQHDLAGAQAIADVAAYLSALAWNQSGGIGDGEFIAHGRNVYQQRCETCHGATGAGDSDKLVPRLAGQQYGYLLREMHDAVEGRRPNFSLKHIRLLQKLDRDDFVGLADFLSRAAPPRDGSQASAHP